MIELVLPIIKYVMAPLEVAPEIALNLEIGWIKDLGVYLLIDFEILN
jgi:hypothetical protein